MGPWWTDRADERCWDRPARWERAWRWAVRRRRGPKARQTHARPWPPRRRPCGGCCRTTPTRSTLRTLDGPERFAVDGSRGRGAVAGTSPAVAAHRRALVPQVHCDAHISLGGRPVGPARTRLPAPRSAPVAPATVPHRFALNDTHDGYTAPYADWARWERLIDVLALHGVQRGAGHARCGGRLPPAAPGLRLLRRRGARLDPGAAPPAVVAAAEHDRLRRPGQPRTAAHAHRAGPAHRRRLRELGMRAGAARLLRYRPGRLRRPQPGRPHRSAGHLVRAEAARLARPAHRRLPRGRRRLLPAPAGAVRHRRPLQDGPAARGRRPGRRARCRTRPAPWRRRCRPRAPARPG